MFDFIPYEVVFSIGDKNTYEVFLKYQVKSVADEEKLRHSKWQWRTLGAKSAPFHSGGLTQRNGAKAAPFALPNGARISSVELTYPPLGSIWRTHEGEKEKLELALDELGELITETAKMIDGYDRLLAPYWYAKGDVEDRIRRTHGRRAEGAIVFDLAGAGDRRPLFDDLMALAVEWGSTKTERANVQTRLKGYEREAGKIETELKRMAKRKGKANG